ncbi:MAG: phosphoglycerate dehydrogenase [Rhodospirillales bacterium]
MPKVLISDKMSPLAEKVFKERGIEVDSKPDITMEELKNVLGQYDGLAVRSRTKVKADMFENAGNLKVIGRAGIGVDNIDIKAATQRGIVVMNAPFGNSITTAEHAIAMMFALAREIPEANASTHAGKWEKNRFMGVELTAKTLGIIGCGNIGSIVATKAVGLGMKVIAYDPFLSPERATDLGVEKVEMDDLFTRADFITLHTPLTDATKNIIRAETIAKMKKGVRIINCARGGLVVEEDLKAALDSGHVAGAALDVLSVEPATEHILFGMENVVLTPHLGAATSEAQENVAEQIAEQMSDFLLRGSVVNAINTPSISAEDAPKLTPYLKLAEQIGSFAGQVTDSAYKAIKIEYEGHVADLNTKPLTASILQGLLAPLLESVNLVNAPAIAKERDISVSESHCPECDSYQTLIRLTVTTENQTRSLSGTLFDAGIPRLVNIKGIGIDARLGPNMLYITNQDKPGFIGSLGTLLGNAGINIATFHLGRDEEGGDAIALVEIDQPADASVIEAVRALPQVVQVKALRF